MVRRASASAGEKGLTLVEATVALVLLVAVIGLAVSTLLTTTRVLGQASDHAVVEATAQRAANIVIVEVRQSGRPGSGSGIAVDAGTPTPGGGPNRIVFRKNLGFDETTETITWSPAVTFAFEYDDRESGNGLDDDGDGLVDEGRLVRLDTDPGGAARRIVVADRLLDTLRFELDPGGGFVTLTVEAAARLEDGTVRKHVVREQVSLRN